MSTKLRRGRSRVAVFAVVAMVAGLLALPLSAGAATAACPDTIPSAGFTDMGGYSTLAQDAVDCIAFYEVTAGVGTGLYGPAQNVPRWQMAIFLWKVLVAGGETVDTSAFGFTDIGGKSATAQGAINAIANAGISVGKGGGLFAPDDNVTRTEMAFFLAATLEELGVTLDTTAFGFTDIGALSAAAQDAINSIANAGVSAGTGGGLYGPADLTTRVQMALFLAASMDEAGIVPPGDEGVVTRSNASNPDFYYADAFAGAEVKVTTKTTDTFYVDGTLASSGVFFVNLTIGDTVSVTGTTYKLTNVDTSKITSGYVDDPNAGADTFDFVEPITGTVLHTYSYATKTWTLFEVDGTAVSETSFDGNIQAGDWVSIDGAGTAADKLRTISLDNMTVVGEIAVVAATTFTVDNWAQVFDAATADTLTIDGAAADAADWTAEASDCDQVTMTYASGLLNIAMVNCALGSGDGVATGVYVAGTSYEVDFLPAFDTNAAFADGNILNADVDNFLMDGSLVTAGEFEAKITPGDLIKWTPVDGEIVKTSTLSLTNVNGLVAADIDSITIGANTLQVIWDDLPSADISYHSSAVSNVGLTGTSVVWQVNGVASAATDTTPADGVPDEWEDDVAALVAAPSIDPTLTISIVDGKIVYNVES